MSRRPSHPNDTGWVPPHGQPAQHHLPPRPTPHHGSAVPNGPAWRRQGSSDARVSGQQGRYSSWLPNEARPNTFPHPSYSSAVPYHDPSPNHQPVVRNSVAGPSTYSSGPYWPPVPQSPRAYSTHASASPRQTSPSSSSAGKYVPLHLRSPLAKPGVSDSDTPSSFREKRSPAPSFTIPLPDKAYMELSTPDIIMEDTLHQMAPKLLVLDLNGTLIYRNKGGSNSRTSYPRPYLGCFLEYLFRDLTNNSPRPWHVFVWSSAQPHNVRTMLESTFDAKHIAGLWDEKKQEDEVSEVKDEVIEVKDEGSEAEDEESESDDEEFESDDPEEDLEVGKVLGVWARDKMGLSEQEYAHKTQTTKDLRKVEAHFGNVDSGYKEFPLETILLLDDSPLKAVHQPWNQLVLPEYERTAYQATKQAIRQSDETAGTDCDQYLLAVIGILEATSSFENIPSWIRAGGLKKPDIQDLATEEEQNAEWEEGWGVWRGKPDGPAAGVPPTLESLPTHESFEHWFQDPKLVKRWIEKGKEALQATGIAIEHGIDPAASVRGSPAPTSRSDWRRQGSAPPLPLGHSVPSARQRGYSPSRPTSPTKAGENEQPSDDNRNLVEEVPQSVQPPKQNKNGPIAASLSSTGQARSFSTANTPYDNAPNVPHPRSVRNDRPVHVDTWRTFRSADVASYLGTLTKRQTLKKQDQKILGAASRLLRRLNMEIMEDPSWDRWGPPSEAGARRTGNSMEMEEGEVDEPMPTTRPAEIVQNGGSVAPDQGNSRNRRDTAREDRRKESRPVNDTRQLPNPAVDSEYNPADAESDFDDDIDPSIPVGARVIIPGTVSSRTRGANAGGVLVEPRPDRRIAEPSRMNGQHPNVTGRASNPHEPEVEIWSADDLGPANIVYPLEHPTSNLDLPPAAIDGTTYSAAEVARFFARAPSNIDPNQQGYLREIAMREVGIGKAWQRKQQGQKLKCNIESETNRIIKLRKCVIKTELIRDQRDAAIRERHKEIEWHRARGLPPPPDRSLSPSLKPPRTKKDRKLNDLVKPRISNKNKNKHKALNGQDGGGDAGAGSSGANNSEQGSRSSKRRATDDGEQPLIKVQRVE